MTNVNKKTIEEILSIMGEQLKSNHDVEFDKIEEFLKEEGGELCNENLNGTDFKYITTEGGEGEGDFYAVVYEYTPTEQYFGPVGWYASHYGHEFEEVRLLEKGARVVYR